MSNVVRLTNGGTIQVRTGVLQGIGPQGERGFTGPQGQQGEQGQTGETGPMGAILQQATRVSVAQNNPIAANTDTLIAFGSVGYDDLSAATSSSNFTLNTGDHLLSCWLRFDDAAAGSREIWFGTGVGGGTMIARASRASVAGAPYYVDLSFPYRAAAGDIIQVFARSAAATGVSLGSLSLNRVGSGPPGPQGVVGPQGSVGATGAVGPPGPAGSANSGFVKYGDMLPH